MRLICGIFRLDGCDAPERCLRAMIAQMEVPGLCPWVRLWREGSVGLAILDFSARGARAAALPNKTASIMAADVRLDDPETLNQAVGGVGCSAEDELLQAALESNGADGLDRVLGDFAFASWNRTAQRLTCGRDAFGIRPFAYVHQPGKLFAFASLPKALHGSGLVPKRVDEDAVARRMVFASRSDDSLVAGIRRLPAAHYMTVTREGVSLACYWQPDRAGVGSRKCSPEEAAYELRRLVDQAVRCRLPHAGEIGAHLSGGLDSSAIAVLAARRLREDGRTLHAYSFLGRQQNDITLEDETEFVKAVVQQEGDLDWTPIRPMAQSSLGGAVDADKIAPIGADDLDNAVCAHAAEQGIGLILSGWGGDEAASFNGRGTFAELFLRGRWRTLAREVSALSRERRWSMLRVIRSEIVSYLTPDAVAGLVRRISRRPADVGTSLRQVLSSGARRRLAVSPDERLGVAPDGRENRWRLVTSPHIARRAEEWAQTGARHGLAFAFPLLDRRVVEFALALPSELFLRGGFRRRPFRDAMADVLPETVRWRHLKYPPFPGYLLDLAESKDEFLARIDTYVANDSVCRVIDLGHLRGQVEAFPSPERLREELCGHASTSSTTAMAAAAGALAAAEYLYQHGGKMPTPNAQEGGSLIRRGGFR